MAEYLVHYGVKGMKWGKRKSKLKTGLSGLLTKDAQGFYPRPEDPRAHRQNLATIEYDKYIRGLMKKYGVRGSQSATTRNQFTSENYRIGFELGSKMADNLKSGWKNSGKDMKKLEDMGQLGSSARYQRILDEMSKGKPLNLNNKTIEDASKEYLSSPKAKSDAALADEILRKNEAEWNKKHRKK